MIKKPLKILVVDDEIIIARNLQNTLMEIGYDDPCIACSSQEAFDEVKRSKPGMIFMDINLGEEMDGIQAAEIIVREADIPIIFLTAFADDITVQRAKQLAPYGYLVKPVSERDIRLILDVALGRHEAEIRLKQLTAQIQTLNQSLDLKVEEKTQELRQKNADLEQFVFAIAHDLQEPTRVIANFIEMLKSDCPAVGDDEVALRYLAIIEKSAIRMRGLIACILNFARTSHVAIEMQDTNVKDVFDDLVLQNAESIQQQGASLSCSDLPLVRVNRELLSIVLKNLLENALKYCSHEPPVIRLSCQTLNKYWLFTFKDNGIGFEQSQAIHIFGLFKRLHAAGTYPGFGLGLALCKKIIERHHGEMWADSSPGKGAEFHFTLPKQSGLGT